MDLLGNLFGQVESGNNPNAAPSATGAVGILQQFPAFQQQFGNNNSGVASTDIAIQNAALDNFAAQAVAATPNLSIGDLYAEYYGGTGTPGSGTTFHDLPATVQNNFLSAGIDPGTPAADFITQAGLVAVNSATNGGSNGKSTSLNPMNMTCTSYTADGSCQVFASNPYSTTTVSGGDQSSCGAMDIACNINALKTFASSGFVNLALAAFALVLLLMALAPRQSRELIMSAIRP